MNISQVRKNEWKTIHEGKILRFGKLGDGIIPLHKNPKLHEDLEYRRYIKTKLLGRIPSKEDTILYED